MNYRQHRNLADSIMIVGVLILFIPPVLMAVKAHNDKKTVPLQELESYKDNPCIFNGIKNHLANKNIIHSKHLRSIKYTCENPKEIQNNPAYQEQLKVLEG